MKKFFSLFIFTILSLTINAQTRNFNSFDFSESHFRLFRNIADTLVPLSFVDTSSGGLGCANSVYTVDVSLPVDSGYVTGTNVYNDSEKGQRYFLSDFGYQNVTINKVRVHFGIIQPGDSSGFVFAKIYNLNAVGFPDSLIGTTDSITVSDLVGAVNGMAELNFTAPILISNSFVMSIDFSNSMSDTLAIVHTETNCFDTTGGAWEKWNDDTWHSINNSWQFETDLAIFPVMSDGVLINSIQVVDISEINIFPNPANQKLFIESAFVFSTILVYDLAGRILEQKWFNELNKFELDISLLSPGIYFIKAGGKELNFIKKIVVSD